MGTQINTIESRIRFVKGQVTTGTPAEGFTACGSGTAHPVVAKLDQIAEMFCRVRNTKITAYEVYQEHASNPTTNTKWWSLFNTGNVPAHNFVSDSKTRHQRGLYFTSTSNTGWLTAHCGPVYTTGFGNNYADAKDELALWPYPAVYGPTHGMDHLTKNIISPPETSAPSTYGSYVKRQYPADNGGETQFSSGEMGFYFGPTVAFVGGDSPFSSGVTLYPNAGFSDTHFNHSSVFGTASNDGNAQVVLSSGTLLIPIHLQPISGYSATLVTSPRLEVSEWWPYAKSDGSPAWSTTTGLPL
jgi:hypothetical protein